MSAGTMDDAAMATSGAIATTTVGTMRAIVRDRYGLPEVLRFDRI